MKRFACVIVMFASLTCGRGMGQPVEIEFEAPGFGANIPVGSYSFGMRGYHTSPGGPDPRVTDVVVTRLLDVHSPDFANAALFGTGFSMARIRACSPECGAPTEYFSIEMENALISSYSLGSSGGEPTENITFSFAKMLMEYKPEPEPPKTGWGAILPQNLPVGGMEPYDFDFFLNPPVFEALFDRPLSDLGNTLPATLLHVDFIPEPGGLPLLVCGVTALLLGSGRCLAENPSRAILPSPRLHNVVRPYRGLTRASDPDDVYNSAFDEEQRAIDSPSSRFEKSLPDDELKILTLWRQAE